MKETAVGVFQAIVRKELRENLVWAALGLVLMYVVLIGSLPAQPSPELIRLFSITPFAAVIGLMIARAQFVSENRGDKWGFLVHRPVSRALLFWAKTSAGLMLFLGSVGFPIVSVAFWLTKPGHIAAPFDWRLTLPAIADTVCGIAFYFAGVLTAMRDARWYASRALGIGVGFICALAILTMTQTFGMAVAVCSAGILITAVAARGTFIAGGQYATQSRISCTATGISIACGIGVVGYIALAFVIQFVLLQYPAGVPIDRPGATRYKLSSDGIVVQILLNGGSIQVNDLQGNPIDKYKSEEARKAVDNGVRQVSASIDPDGRRSLALPTSEGYRSAAEVYVQLEARDLNLSSDWFYIRDLGLIAGYDRFSKRLIGWLGPGGFKAGDTLPATRFHGYAQSYWMGEPVIAFTDAVYRVELKRRSIEKVFTAPAGESILGAAGYSDSSEGGPFPADSLARLHLIATDQSVYVESSDGKTHFAIPRNPNAATYGYVEFLQATQAPGAPMFLWYIPEGGSHYTLSEALGMPMQVTQLSQDGGVAANSIVPRLGAQLRTSNFTPGTFLMPMALRPLLDFATDHRAFSLNLSQGHLFTGWAGPGLLGLVIAGFIFARGRQNAFPPGRLLLWTTLGFALGPLGLALMFSLIDWPVKEHCPNCDRNRVVTREQCEHCGAPFPGPVADGTEIFENG